MATLLYTNKLQYGSPTAKYVSNVETFKTDSYTIRAAVGINSVTETYELVWAGLTKAEATALLAQLRTAKGVDLLQWQPPLETSALDFTCAQFNINEYPGEADYFLVSATLNREYDN